MGSMHRVAFDADGREGMRRASAAFVEGEGAWEGALCAALTRSISPRAQLLVVSELGRRGGFDGIYDQSGKSNAVSCVLRRSSDRSGEECLAWDQEGEEDMTDI